MSSILGELLNDDMLKAKELHSYTKNTNTRIYLRHHYPKVTKLCDVDVGYDTFGLVIHFFLLNLISSYLIFAFLTIKLNLT